MYWNHFCKHALRFWTAVPWLLLATIYTLGLRTTYVLGHFPHCCMDNSPDEWFCNALSWLNYVLMYAMLACPILQPLFLGLNRLQAQRDDWRIHVGVFTLGWATFIFLVIADPGGIMNWWGD